MLKKRVVKVLLPLLFSFCCVFSGFLSVDAFAYNSIDGTYIDSFVFTTSSSNDRQLYISIQNSAYTGLYVDYADFNSDKSYGFSNNNLSDVYQIRLGNDVSSFDFQYFPDLYDYYLAITIHSNDYNSASDFTFLPNTMIFRSYDGSGGYVNYNSTDVSYTVHEDRNNLGFTIVGKIPYISNSSIDTVYLRNSTVGTVSSDIVVEGLILAYNKNSQQTANSIVAAINNQTNTLDGSIGQAADDIQQSIEDQYSGDPETEFSVDDVITQHNEKMGVLSFGSDVMLQFLDMFQSANVGTAQLTLPGFNITVENVEYSVWPDYSFNFEQLNEWVPALMSVIRVMLPAFVWLMVLRYCINVFEKNFLSNGG